jgi:predicted transglutaminase-like protease
MTKPFDFMKIDQVNNQFYLPSMHSAIKVDILEQKITGDTLEIKYQAGTNKKIKSNTRINLRLYNV